MNKILSFGKKGTAYLVLESAVKVLLVAGLVFALGWTLVHLGIWIDI